MGLTELLLDCYSGWITCEGAARAAAGQPCWNGWFGRARLSSLTTTQCYAFCKLQQHPNAGESRRTCRGDRWKREF
eukprot:5185-Amphidinium_carterae.1